VSEPDGGTVTPIWSAKTVVEARAIIRILLDGTADPSDHEDFRRWLSANNPEPWVYMRALREASEVTS
jgi:hypothetical protein